MKAPPNPSMVCSLFLPSKITCIRADRRSVRNETMVSYLFVLSHMTVMTAESLKTSCKKGAFGVQPLCAVEDELRRALRCVKSCVREHVENGSRICSLSVPSKTAFMRAERRKKEKSIIQDGTNHDKKGIRFTSWFLGFVPLFKCLTEIT